MIAISWSVINHDSFTCNKILQVLAENSVAIRGSAEVIRSLKNVSRKISINKLAYLDGATVIGDHRRSSRDIWRRKTDMIRINLFFEHSRILGTEINYLKCSSWAIKQGTLSVLRYCLHNIVWVCDLIIADFERSSYFIESGWYEVIVLTRSRSVNIIKIAESWVAGIFNLISLWWQVYRCLSWWEDAQDQQKQEDLSGAFKFGHWYLNFRKLHWPSSN